VSDLDGLHLAFSSTNQGRIMTLCDASFPPAFRLRLYALVKGDVVRVSGSIKKVLPEAVYISATNFSLVKP
jgi:hypothetical protein